MSTENPIPLRDQVLSWFNQNQYTRASFDRLISHVMGAGTYEQLRELVYLNPDVFRSIIIKGGYEGMALVTETAENVQSTPSTDAAFNRMMQQLGNPSDNDLVHRIPAQVLQPVYPVGPLWSDISTEEYREYLFRNGQIIRVNHPLQLQLGSTIEGRVGGPSHVITARDGMGHYIPAGWLLLSWKAKPGAEVAFS